MRHAHLAASICALIGALLIAPQQSHAATPTRDGSHDFDFEIGRWTIDAKRLEQPLRGSTTWVTPKGLLHLVRPVWEGKASLAELKATIPTPRYLGLMLRTYNPATREWSIYWGSSSNGVLDHPLIGHFTDGRGEFHGDDTFDGKPIKVRVTYSGITPTSFHTEQFFSSDGGATWERNLIQNFARISR